MGTLIRLIAWIVLVYIFAKIIGVILQVLRPLFNSGKHEDPAVGKKGSKEQFNNIQDAEFEDITDKK